MEKHAFPARHLEMLDYSIITLFIIIPMCIGAYYAYKQRKGTTVISYLLADRKVKYLAIAMSSFSTMISTTTFVGIPADIYTYGTMLTWHLVTQILAFPLYTEVFIPIYVNLNSCSMYTYFKLRYNIIIWKTCAVVGLLHMLLSLSIIIFASSNVFARVTGIGMWPSAAFVVSVCIAYTAFGGMKAVIWTDFFQGIVIIVTVLLIVIVGTNYADGFSNVWTANRIGHRLDIFDTNFDMTERHTMWSSMFGFFLNAVAYQAGNQATAQRYLAARDLKTAQRAATFGLTMKYLSWFFFAYIALMVYAVNKTCDPVTGLGLNPNQLVPDFIMKAFGPYPGFPGIFIAGIMSALLSTMSSMLNAMSAVTLQDLSGVLTNSMSEKKKVIVCQILVVFYGTVSLLGLHVIRLFPNVFQASNIIQILAAAIITLILIGTFLPQVNTKAVMIAFATGILIITWISTGNLMYGHKHRTKPMDISGCYRVANNTWGNSSASGFTVTSLWNRTEEVDLSHDKYNEGLWFIYDISNVWLTFFATLCITLLSYLLTWILGIENKCVDCMHLIPLAVQKLHRYLPKTARKLLLCDIYDDVKDSLEERQQQPREETQLTILKTTKQSSDKLRN